MDLLLGTGQQQQQQQPGTTGGGGAAGTTASAPTMAEKPPGTAGSDAMSRPSLISSLWSIQVQNEDSASDFPMAGCGSQQSLPEMLNQSAVPEGGMFHHCNGFPGGGPSVAGCSLPQADMGAGPMDHQPAMAGMGAGTTAAGNNAPLRPVKSLSDLCTLTAAQIAQTASVMPCHSHAVANDQSYLGFRRQTETGAFYNVLSKQQRDSQICEWLQKLNVSGGSAGTEHSGSESPSQEFYQQQFFQQQQRPSFHRSDTTEQ